MKQLDKELTSIEKDIAAIENILVPLSPNQELDEFQIQVIKHRVQQYALKTKKYSPFSDNYYYDYDYDYGNK